MNNDLCVILAYCNNEKKIDLLKKCIIDLKNKNKDIFITSHYPLPFDIQKMVEYYYYDHNNDILTQKNGGFQKYNIGIWEWNRINNYKISYNYTYLDPDLIIHAYPIWTLIQNAISLIKIKNYKKIHIIDYDVLIGPSDILEEHNKILDENECVIYYKHHVLNVFSMLIETADKIFSLYKNIDDYYIHEKLDFLFENRFHQLLIKHNIKFHQFPDGDLYKKTVYLNGNSELNNSHNIYNFYNQTDHFYFMIISDYNHDNYIIIDNKKTFEYECTLIIDGNTKQFKMEGVRNVLKLDVNKKEYHLIIIIDNTILFDEFVKVREHIYYEKE